MEGDHKLHSFLASSTNIHTYHQGFISIGIWVKIHRWAMANFHCRTWLKFLKPLAVLKVCLQDTLQMRLWQYSVHTTVMQVAISNSISQFSSSTDRSRSCCKGVQSSHQWYQSMNIWTKIHILRNIDRSLILGETQAFPTCTVIESKVSKPHYSQ